MTVETRLFINNEYVPSVSGATFSVYDPTTEKLITDQVQAAMSEDVDKAVAAASEAFKVWKATSTAERSAIMLRYADLIDANAEMLASLETLCMGAPISLVRQLVQAHSSALRYYAGLADKVHGESYNEDGDGLLKLVNYEPIGVCAGISAWNGTHLSLGWKIAPAIAAGNTILHKTSEKDPLSTLALGSLIKEAGFPPGVINLLSGDGATGALLASHMGIRKIAFTGSVTAGRKVQQAATESNLKHVTLELGGKSPAIVFEDANIENALFHNSQIFLANNTQACSAATRLFIHESIAPKFIEGLKESFERVAGMMGDPKETNTFLGPMADKAQRDRVYNYIHAAKAEGIQVLTGGNEISKTGYYADPTIFLNPDLNSAIYNEEVFGPVLVVRTFKTEDEVVQLANDTEYGLSAIVFTSNISRALKVASKLEVGTLSINGAHYPSKHTPWSGWKQSGYGMEGGLGAIKEYMHTKTIHVHLNA